MQVKKIFSITLGLFGVLFSSNAVASYARDWQMGFQEAATAVMRDINDFHNLLQYRLLHIHWFLMHFREFCVLSKLPKTIFTNY